MRDAHECIAALGVVLSSGKSSAENTGSTKTMQATFPGNKTEASQVVAAALLHRAARLLQD